VSAKSDEWIVAEVLRDEFVHAERPIELTDDNLLEATVEFSARFLKYISQRLHENPESTAARTAFLLNVFRHFVSTYLLSQDVHSFVASFDTEVRKTVLASYFLALATLQEQAVNNIPTAPASALLNAATKGAASIYALFGGQGTNEVYFDELQFLYDVYRPFVSAFISTITDDLLKPLAEANQGTPFYNFGMDVTAWLSGASPRPPTAYLASVPMSFPLIGLTQLVQYLIVCRVSGLTPVEMRTRIAGATGHSQGIVSAVAISASTTFESFLANAIKALKWLFFCGLRGQEAFPVTSLEPSIIEDSIKGGEGSPTPMLLVTGLLLKDLEPHVRNTNTHLLPTCKLFISLYNGARAFVVNGPARSLYGLVTNLRKVRAPSGADQSKIPYSQRKAAFNVRFLVIGVPFHNKEYIGNAGDKVRRDVGEELWEAKDLGVAVYHTEDGSPLHSLPAPRSLISLSGSDLRTVEGSITQSLCDQIFTQHIHWPLATDFPESATHAVDFGPGGLSGIGPLTARNLEGRGVRVITIGDRANGEAELFDSRTVKYEEWWSKKFAPRLVQTRYVQSP
jgi:fatty acid synthase subunit alpha, fungi type